MNKTKDQVKALRNVGHQYMPSNYIIFNDNNQMYPNKFKEVEVWTTPNSRKLIKLEKDMNTQVFIDNILEFINFSLELGKSRRSVYSIFRRLGFESLYRANGIKVVSSKKRGSKEQIGWLDKEEYKVLLTSIKHR